MLTRTRRFLHSSETGTPSISPPGATSKFTQAVKVVVLTTVMFTFISYWRAAAVVIADMGSTAYYIGGIVEQFIGKAAPYFIMAVMLFSLAVRAVYIESCSMFVRGGVYRVVKSALGGWFAKISVSALVFDYVLTGPVSSLSAGKYFIGLINDSIRYTGLNLKLDMDIFPMIFAIFVVLYFWRANVKGIEESSGKSLKIFITTVIMAVIVLGWSAVTLSLRPEGFLANLPDATPQLSDEAYGWLKDFDWVRGIGLIAILIGFGHSMLAMSGEETLAQVYREIESPKLKNLKKVAIVMFVFTFTLTTSVSFLGVILIPDEQRAMYIDNLIGGITMNLIGPNWILLLLQAFVVIVGALILSGAVNTSIIGANGVLNRVAEDKILTDWFRKPHRKYGTTSRTLNLIMILQIATIILSRGNILVLGEAYAFGVIWSFTFNAFSMLLLRFKDKRPREWKVPINLKIGSKEIPIGLSIVFFALLTVALTNLFTKPIATVAGITFTICFFLMFTISEFINRKKIMEKEEITEDEFVELQNGKILEHFNLESEAAIDAKIIGSLNESRILVGVKDPGNLSHLRKIIQETDTETTDIIVMIARVFKDRQNTIVDENLDEEERHLFSEVVNVAEAIGKPVIPIVVPTNNAFFALVNAAKELNVKEIVLGLSDRYKFDVQIQQLAILWGTVQSDESKTITLRVITKTKDYRVNL